MLVFAVLLGVAGYFLVRTATAGPEGAVKQFLAAVAAEDDTKAYDYFSAPLKDKQPLETFTEMARANPSLFDVAETTFSERSVDSSGVKLAGTVKLKAGVRDTGFSPFSVFSRCLPEAGPPERPAPELAEGCPENRWTVHPAA